MDHWHAQKSGREIPLRMKMDPVALGPALRAIFLLDVLNVDHLSIRLACTRLCELYGRELKGANFLEFWRGDCRRTVRALVSNLISLPAGGILDSQVEFLRGRPANAHFLLLPVADAHGEATQLICAASASPRPHMSGDAPVVRQVLRSVRLIDPDLLDATSRSEAIAAILRFPLQTRH